MDDNGLGPEAMAAEVMHAVELLQGGDRAAARAKLLELWDRLGDGCAPRLRSTLAHFLADTEEEPELELEWDLLALEAATRVDGSGQAPELQDFLPSLHLNVGDAYRRVGNPGMARHHAELGLRHSDVLPDEGYGATVKEALRRLSARVSA